MKLKNMRKLQNGDYELTLTTSMSELKRLVEKLEEIRKKKILTYTDVKLDIEGAVMLALLQIFDSFLGIDLQMKKQAIVNHKKRRLLFNDES